jgi:Cadherin-like domain
VLAAVDDAPSAQGETVMGASEDAVFNINKSTLLANDHDIDNADSDLSLSWVGNATGGTVSLDASGNVVFTPTLNFNGNATFQYKVRDPDGLESPVVQAVIPVTAVNDAPVAVDDQFATYNNSTLTIAFNQLTSNDIDVENDSLTVSAVRDHANGHASIVNGQVQFIANSGFSGAASFDYLTDDGHGGQSWATAYVDVVTPPNQYATVNYTGGFGYIVDPNRVGRMDVNFTISDDGPSGSVQMALTSARLNTWGYTWLSVPNSNYGIFGGRHTDYSLSLTGNVGVFSVTGPSFDLLETTWTLTDDRGLQNIWHWNVYGFNNGSSFNSVTWNEHTGTYSPPVILDLNGDGVHFTSIQNSNVKMDVNHDGINDKMAWAGNDDGVLVWDKDHNHQITDASEFGFQTLKAGAQTDLEGLQALDTNGNGLLDAGDAKFAEFAVWQDANGNGVTDAGEFKTLTHLGIASINLHSDGQVRDAGTLLANSGSGETDATVMGNAAFTRTDGSTGVVADTMLAYEAGHATQAATITTVVDTSVHTLVSAPQPIEQPIEISANATPQVVETSAADAQTAEIIRQALLFNQVCNTAVAIDSAPLGFVPIQPDVQLHDMLVTPQDGSNQLAHSA